MPRKVNPDECSALCSCVCHQRILHPDKMTKWMLIQEIQKYGTLKYATCRNREELTQILMELRKNNENDEVSPKGFCSVKTTVTPQQDITTTRLRS